MNSAVKLGVIAVFFLGGLMACAKPKIMLYDSFLPGTNKVARESLKVSGDAVGGASEVSLTNFYIQVCDVNNGQQSNCKTTLILDNITNYAVAPRL